MTVSGDPKKKPVGPSDMAKKRILIDTDVLIDYSKGFSDRLEKLLQASQTGEMDLSISPVNIAEFLNNKDLKSESIREKGKAFLKLFRVEPLDRETGERAGDLLRQGKAMYLGDALIAAACLQKNLLLMTRNKKHFLDVKDLNFFE